MLNCILKFYDYTILLVHQPIQLPLPTSAEELNGRWVSGLSPSRKVHKRDMKCNKSCTLKLLYPWCSCFAELSEIEELSTWDTPQELSDQIECLLVIISLPLNHHQVYWPSDKFTE